ncbi:MAG: SRPBCC domain-containing protein [Candidatus Acidiferrales bacterium]
MAYLERYRAVLEDQMGPFRLRADLDITVTEVHPEARVTVIARSEDRQVGSRITVMATMALAASPNGTAVTLEGQSEVTGQIATLGTAAMKKKDQIILDEFVHHAGVELHMAGTSPT